MTLPFPNNFSRLRPFHPPLDLHQNFLMLRHSASDQAEAAKCFLEEGSEQPPFHCPLSGDPDPTPHETPKCHVKQGLAKSSKKFKGADPKSKGDNE